MTEVIVEADGGSRGNPGPAGYGAVVFDADHARVLAERKEYLGVTTNNVAEYRGLIAGLAASAELGATVVAVRMDSKLVVEQMSGRWKVKHPSMIPLVEQARALVAGFDRVSFTWIPRAENSHADRLANEAMDDGDLVGTVREAVAAGHAPGDQVVVAARDKAEVGSVAAEQIEGDPALDGGAAQRVPSNAPGWTGALGRPTRLLLLRHGQTELSIERRYSGRGNPPLTELGRQQAERAAKMLAAKGDIAAVVTSPLQRARTTAEAAAAALDVPLRVLDGLIETDFGDWEGLTFAEAAQRDPQLHTDWLGDPSIPAPGGESFDQVRERVESVRRDLVALYPGQNIVVVSHVTPIKTLLQLALGVGPSLLYRLHLDLASLCIAEFYPDGGASVRLVNDVSYLS
ncbi:bifunctional RNase H/acid phosphatase [Nocardia neocaledoniensis NBRC 108232]|uniref:Putative phosphoglycerate mutase n=1 Tax=Nocardia neocaledoniensis TaxID=236511 RepID=A0A317N7B4_9NOCA|nr:bifunctional RNase H/acid phosphatase [Nocardia neocaledoniensis]PWV71181.1 putative phosphoglycerate mutase [Nocardia neocaledoniensis]GEM31798.1 bifunctional RNase H/acid phosphatase [Nocardia neocaledoniensis NBRC 108232]